MPERTGAKSQRLERVELGVVAFDVQREGKSRHGSEQRGDAADRVVLALVVSHERHEPEGADG